MATAQIKVNGVLGSNTSITLGNTVYFSNQDNWGVTIWEWTLVSQPFGAPYTFIQNADGPTPFMVLNKEGSYLVKLVVNKGLEDETTDQIVVAVRELETDARIPAVGETTEVGYSDGWTVAAINEILRFVARLQVDGLIPAVAGEALSIGDLVYVGGIQGQGQPVRGVAKCFKALASNEQHMNGLLGIVLDNIPTHNMGVNEGDRIQVRVTGFLLGVTQMEAGGNVGDKVFVSDTGGFSLVAGTFPRQIGTVANAIAGTHYMIYVSGYPPGVPAGPAGGVLGYPGSRYPNPLGLSALLIDDSSIIPMVPVVGRSEILFRPDAAETGTSVTVSGGDVTGPYIAGAAMLRGGTRTDTPANEFSRVEVSGAFSNESGYVRIWTGDTTDKRSGVIDLHTGAGEETGGIDLITGQGSGTGGIRILTGNGGTRSGGMLIRTGSAPGPTGIAGNIQIKAGGGPSVCGDIYIRAGQPGVSEGVVSTERLGNLILLPGTDGFGLWGALTLGENNYQSKGFTAGSLLYVIPPDESVNVNVNVTELLIGAEGQFLVASGGAPVWKDFFNALPSGSENDVLQVVGGVPAWSPINTDPSAIYGCFSSSTNQPIGTGATLVTLDTPATPNGVDLVTNTQVMVMQDGVYGMNLSPQLVYGGAGTETVTFWLRVDGNNVPNSAKSLVMNSNNNRTSLMFELTLPLTGGQVIEWVCCAAVGTSISMQHTAAVSGPPIDIPAIPSVVFNIRRIGA